MLKWGRGSIMRIKNKVRSRKEVKGLRVALRVEKEKIEGFIWKNGL